MSQDRKVRMIPNQQPSPTGETPPNEAGQASSQVLQMPETLHQELQLIDNVLAQEMFQIGKLTLTLDKLKQSMLQKDQEITKRVAGFAAAHGVDLSKTDKGRWNFDLSSGTLTRLKSE